MLYMASVGFEDDDDESGITGKNGVQPDEKHATDVF